MSLLHDYKHQAFFLYIAWIISLVWSMEAVTSIAMILLLLIALFQRNQKAKIGISLRQHLQKNFTDFWNERDFLMMTIPFLLVLVTSIYSSDINYTLERLRIKLPFLILPFAIFSVPRFKRRTYFTLLYAFMLTTSSAVFYALINYWLNFEEVQMRLSTGKHIPVPVNHIRFNIMVVYSIIGGIFLSLTNYCFKWNWERYIIRGLTLFLFIAIHILSVKSGIISTYLVLLYLLTTYIIRSRKYLLGILGILGILSLPVLAYHTLPSLKTKVYYTIHDIKQSLEGKGETYSDSQRLISIQNGLKVALANPVFGVGAGDVKQETEKVYKKDYPSFKPQRPHNQLVSVFVGTGIVGLLIFIGSFGLMAWHRKNYRDPLFMGVWIVILFSFMVENTIENAVGVGLTCLMLLFAFKGKNRD